MPCRRKSGAKPPSTVPENEVLNVLEGDDAKPTRCAPNVAARSVGRRWTATLSILSVSCVCGNNPTCDGFEIEEGEFRIKGYDGPVVECESAGLKCT